MKIRVRPSDVIQESLQNFNKFTILMSAFSSKFKHVFATWYDPPRLQVELYIA